MDPGNLAHQFKQEIGVSITRFINFRRQELAKSLLGSGLYIQEIADQCGFLDINYFTRLFKRQFDAAPRECRKKSSPFLHVKKASSILFEGME
ncbi:MAG: AraC family transcriptional regulator [Treponema sp.]|nr:AraC family transcriptional regulator [Treponema sp.]